MSSQYIDDIHRFVQTELIQVVDLTSQHWEFKKLPRYVKDMQKTGKWNKDLFIVMVNKFVVQKQRNTAQAQFVPTHLSNKYGLLVYNEVHSFPSHTAESFGREFNIKRAFTLGLSPTPIRNLINFLPIMSFCGNPLAVMGEAKEASRHLLNKDRRNPLLTKWRDDVLKPASKRDEHLADGQETYNKLGKLLIQQLAIGKTPWASDRNTEAMSKHHLGMQNLFMPLIASTNESSRNVQQVAEAQQVYSQGLLGYCYAPGV